MSDLLGRFFISDCGKYIAVQIPGQHQAGGYDVIAVDGSCMWLHGRYTPKSDKDKDPRFLFPEFKHMVTGFSNFGYHNRANRWIPDFELSFCDLDTTKKIKGWTGNTVIAEYKARFKKQINIAGRFKP